MRARRQALTVLAFILLTLATSAWAQDAPDQPAAPVFDVGRLSGIVIDGNDADWETGGLNVKLLGPVDDSFVSMDDLYPRMRLGWDERGLLVLVYVHDDVWVESRGESDLWRNDGVEMFMGAKVGSADWCQWIIAPGMDENQPEVRTSFAERRSDEQLRKLDANITVARTKTDKGYVLEALLPWAALAIEPKEGVEVGLQVIVNDVDAPGQERYFAAWYPGTNTAAFSNLMHRVRLAERPGAPVRARLYSTYDFQQMAAVLAVTAPPMYADHPVSVMDGEREIGVGKLIVDETGWARTRITLPAPPAGKPYMGLDVVLVDASAGTANFPASGLLGQAKLLVDQRAEIVAQYAIDRPWDDLSEASDLIRRHRGMVARAYEWLDTTRLMDSDKRLAGLAEAARIVEAVKGGADYLGAKRNEFTDAYYSTVDGSGQPMVLWVPADYDPAKAYPLMVILHGGGGRPEPNLGREYRRPYLAVQPWARGDTGYRALGEQDVLAALAYVKRWYNVDPARVYVNGGSMGGMGTWAMSTRHPDTYAAAAPLFGTADGLPLENLHNVPIFVMHGGSDWVVAIDHSRYAIDKLQRLGYFAAHKEFPAAGHFIPQGEDFTGDWMLTLRKPDHPKAVTYACESEDQGRAYWLNIRRFADVHQPAMVKAEVLGRGKYQLVTVWPENIEALELDVAGMGVDAAEELLVQVGLTHLTQPAPLPESLLLAKGKDGWQIGQSLPDMNNGPRPYYAGAAAHLFTGEPLLIVRGTAGTADRTAVLAEAADRLSRFSGVPGRENTVTGKLLVKADSEVTDDDLRHFNLILLGTAKDNALVARMAEKLPYAVNDRNELLAGDRELLSLAGAGIRLAYYNPLAPARLIFIVGTDATGPQADRWLAGTSRLLTGSGGDERYAHADLVVQTIGGADRRRMQFDRNWQWRVYPGADQPAPESYASAEAYRQAVARVLRQAGRADFGLVRGAGEDSLAYDAKYFRVADLLTGYTDMRQTLVATVSGADLRQIYRRFVARGSVIAQPQIDPDDIDEKAMYRLAMPPSLTGPLASPRQKNLTNVEAGPDWRQNDLWNALLGR